METQKISYSAVVLTPSSHKKLLLMFKKFIPSNWDVFAHHMTICMGKLPEELKHLLLTSVKLKVTGVGISDKALAIKVEGFYSKNKTPHITIVIDKKNNAKPADSNKIENWNNLNKHVYLYGIVKELPFPSPKKELTESMEIKNIQELPFKDDVKAMGGNIFSVGGRVRDEFLGKDSKDLDILVTGIELEDLEKMLAKYGKVDLVGKSFGIIKFKPFGAQEDIDIAIPRTETKSGTGYQGFDVTADPHLPIESDLSRRDFTINAIAKTIDGEIIDPFNGREDLKNKVIRAVSPIAFSDDPLRMIRAVQFASRFNFKIAPETQKMIQDNAKNIKEISKERILIEFDKIVKKGNPETGIQLLDTTGLFKYIFGVDFKGNYHDFKDVKRMSDFIYLCLKDQNITSSDFYKNNLKGDIDTTKELEALELIPLISEHPNHDRAVVMKMLSKSSSMVNSGVINNYIKSIMQELNSGKYPKSLSSLDIDGNDLIGLGFKGKEIGDKLSEIILAIFNDEIKNKKEEILNFINKKSNIIQEMQSVNDNNITKIAIFDFDNTTIDSPTPENGKKIWKQKTNNDWPHAGWWGKLESLSSDVFDLKPIEETLSGYNRVKNDNSVYKVLLTGRISKFETQIKDILHSHNMKFDEYLFNNKSNTLEFKINEMERLLKKFPNVQVIEQWEDREEHFPYFEKWGKFFELKNPNNKFILHKILS